MRTLDRVLVAAPRAQVFRVAAAVERWPDFLNHYRWVRMLERRDGGGVVEMAAWRPFGLFKYPTWWVSEMATDAAAGLIRYHHVEGITSGMDVEWRVREHRGGCEVTIVHEWAGPRWPLIGRIAANWVIGPVFIHGIASRTLTGVKHHTEVT